MMERWIWLPKSRYPQRQRTRYNAFIEGMAGNYTVAEFCKNYCFEKDILSVTVRFSADTEFQLFCNGEFLATGPACVGGDFIGNEEVRENYYATQMVYSPQSRSLAFFARVKMMPVKICDYSKGHGGFMLWAVIAFSDGTQAEISTDESWLVRYNGAYCAPYQYDARVQPDIFVNAQETENIWHTLTAPIPPRTEEEIIPNGGIIHLSPEEEREVVLPLDMICAGFLRMHARTDGIVSAEVTFRELQEQGSRETVVLTEDRVYRGFELHSAGNLLLKVRNDSENHSTLFVSFITTHYPVTEVASTETDDWELNRILRVCAHTLKYCRQTHHLDSPRHCEPLACTGDYYIESLMTAFSFGDMRLAEFDTLRTAELLRTHDGRMFHTTYSLIWVRMLFDVYMISGNASLLHDCEDALRLLLARFKTYIGENGLIETPPDYMFVDWIYIDDITMHHPPKALGQSCLNMFYFDALAAAEKVFLELGEPEAAAICAQKREALGSAINTHLYDGERGLYFEGLNTPTPENMLYDCLPRNVEQRYYLKHSNILAAYVGVCGDERGKSLIHKIMSGECPGDYQPYFAHFLLEAIYRLGLRDEYTLTVLERWKAPVAQCPKGLVEGFIPPQPDYVFDHSHAWGGTPLCSLPKALLGLEILRPGYEEISLCPSLLGLERARVELPTPFGKVVCQLKEKEVPEITGPAEIKIHIRGSCQ